MSMFEPKAGDIRAWRRDLHQHPELMYDVHRTAGFVAEKLRDFGCDEVVTSIGRTGVVGIIRGQGEGRTLGLRADMDALPIQEETGAPHQSTTPGKMHACGHDGHTAMLLGAAQVLCATRRFHGSAAVIFQPAEEGGAGGKAMIDDGLMERFHIDEVFGMHNLPGMPAGHFGLRPGAMMAAADRFDIVIEGKGAHAAKPHEGIDPVMIGAQVVNALQTLVSRKLDPLKAAVVSVTKFKAGTAYNVIPQTAHLAGTVRTLDADVRAQMQERLTHLAQDVAAAHGARAKVSYHHGYPVTRNHAAQAAFCAKVAADVAGEKNVDAAIQPEMGAEDFSYMLQARPGAFVFIGNGDSAGLHHPAFDFNDEIIPVGVSYWVRLVEMGLSQ